MDALLKDLKHSVRVLLKSPGFTLTAVAALALGIGANTAVFSIVNTVLLKPLPYPDPDRVVMLMNVAPQGSGPGASATKYNVWREQTGVLQDVAAYRATTLNVTGGAFPEQVQAESVSEPFFRLLGLSPLRGRTFTPQEDLPNGGDVAVISYGFWQKRFGGAPDTVGKTVSLSGIPYEVIGILRPGFDAHYIDPVPEVLVPFQLDPNSTDQGNYFTVAARLKPGVTLAAANERMKAAAQEFRRRYPVGLGPMVSFGVTPIQELMVRGVKLSLEILFGAVGFVLLIACANVANLLLVRATGRRRELAIRAAVGAGRGRIIRQLLTESVVLSLAGGVVGLGVGMAGIRALLALSPGGVPRVGEDGALVALDWRVLAFTLAVSIVTGVLFGLIPALQSSRSDLSATLKESSSRTGSGFRQNKARSLLVVVEVGLALVLLVGASLLIRTFAALRSVDPGYTTKNVLTMRMSLTGDRYEKSAAVDQIARNGRERLLRLPGVADAAASCCIPLEGGYGLPFNVVGRAPVQGPYTGSSGYHMASAGYFDVFQIPVLRGRAFNDNDGPGAPPVAIINQALAKQYWKSGDPLNDRIVIGKGVGPEFADPPRQIVGVVGDVRDGGLNRDPRPIIYIPLGQVPDGMTALSARIAPIAWVVRTHTPPMSLLPSMQRELRDASGGLPVAQVRSMDEVVSRSTARTSFDMTLLTVFGASALLLAAIGIYGLMAYSVQQRTQEIGIRMALGASTSSLRGMVVFQGMRLALIGVAIGLAASFGLTRLIASFLFGVKALDPIVFSAVPVFLSVVALLAIWLPARRATHVNPVDALRCE